GWTLWVARSPLETRRYAPGQTPARRSAQDPPRLALAPRRGPRTAKAEPPSLRAGAFLAEPAARLQLVVRPKQGKDGVRGIRARRSWRSSSKLSCEDTGCPNCIRSASERMPARSLAFGLLQELATTRRRPTRSAFEEFPNLAQSLHEYSLALQSASLN